MRKGYIFTLLLFELMALFICENIHSLIKSMDKRAIDEMVQQAMLWSDRIAADYRRDAVLPASPMFFDSIDTIAQMAEGKEIRQTDDTRILTIKKPVGEQLSLIMAKTLDSTLLYSIGKLERILFWLNIIVAFFILLTGFYLVVRFKKDRGRDSVDKLPPLQEYLLELKNSQTELQRFLSEQSQQSLRKEELNKTIIANLHLAVILVDLSDKIEIFNPAAEAIFSRSYALAKNNQVQATIDEYPELLALILQTEKKKSGEVESRQKTFYFDIIPIPELGRLILLRDITEEIKRERIQQINSSLLLLGEMTASLAHEIKNSLGVMFGYARMLEGDGDKSAKIIDEIQFLTRMMESFLNFAKPVETLNIQPSDLKGILTQLGEANDIALSLPEGEMRLIADPLLLNPIFSNLLINAKQAGADRVSFRLEEGETTYIHIADNGCGLDEKHREKIWLPFYSTKEKGTGMGLPIVKKMVLALGGDIQLVRSGPEGSEFLISLYPR